MKKKNKKTKPSPEERLTQNIVKLIESNQTENGIDWVKLGLRIQYRSDGKPYSLLNSMILSESANTQGFKNTQWLTFNQVKQLDGNVKGQTSTYIVLSFPVFEKDASGKIVFDKKGEKQIKTFRKSGMAVFNIEQTGLTPDAKYNVDEVELSELGLSSITQDFINAYPVDIGFNGGNRAYYRPGTHSIHLPTKDQFSSNEALASVLFHEAVHSTGHESMLNREGITGGHKFGSKEYAFEELVAELGSSFICAKYGINYGLQFHASYIESWLKVLKKDSKAIFRASAYAQKACDEVSKYINMDIQDIEKAA